MTTFFHGWRRTAEFAMRELMSPHGILYVSGFCLSLSPIFVLMNVMSFWDMTDGTGDASHFLFRIVMSRTFFICAPIASITGFGMMLSAGLLWWRSHKSESKQNSSNLPE